MRRRAIGWLTAGMLLASAGCLHHRPADAGAAKAPPPALPQIERRPLLFGLPERDSASAPRDGEPQQFLALTAQDAQCLATRASPLGNLLDRERMAEPKRRGPSQSEELKGAMRGFAALAARNDSAETGLELYYHLAEAEAQFELADAGLLVLETTIHRLQKLKDAGAPLPTQPEKLKPELADLRFNRNVLLLGMDKLNVSLREQIGLSSAGPCLPIWPTSDFTILTEPIDEERAVKTALEYRADLASLRRLLHDLSAETLPAVQEMLKSVSSLLGDSQTSRLREVPLVAKCLNDPAEVAQRREQVRQLLAEREESATREVRQAIEAMRVRQANVGLARARFEETAKQARSMKGQVDGGTASPLELLAAQRDELKARSDYVREVIAWQIARAKLRQAQGVLPLECIGTALCPVEAPEH